MKIRYGIIGSGAIGGYYGGKLARAGKDVHFLFHSDYDYVKTHGLHIKSIDGDFDIPNIKAYKTTSDMPACDVVLICLKSNNNRLLKEMLPPLLHDNTVVILIQNGLGLEEDLQKDFPKLHIAGGLAFICSNKLSEGYITHLDQGKLNIGSYSCPNEQILEDVITDFICAGIEAHLVNLDEARWMKLIWNIPYNGLSVVLNSKTDKLMADTNSVELLRCMMLEVSEAANIVNPQICINEKFIDDMLAQTKVMPPYSPSMKLDYDFSRPLEIEYIYSRPIKAAQQAGYEMVRVMMLEKQLKFIEAGYLNP